MTNFKTMNDKKFGTLEVTNYLKIPITEEDNPFGREGEIKYNTKSNCLMIKTQNSWKSFHSKTTPKIIPLQPSAPQNITQKIEKDTLRVTFETIDEEMFDEEIEGLIKQAREYDLKKVKIDKLNSESFLPFLKLTYGNKIKIDNQGDIEMSV